MNKQCFGRTIPHLLAFVVAIFLLTACSGQSSAPGPISPADGTEPASQIGTPVSGDSNTSTALQTTASSLPLDFPVTVRIVGLQGEYLLDDLVLDGSGLKTAGDAVSAACAEAGLEMKSSGTGSFFYISSIGSLAERKNGAGSGWVFFHNGVYSTKSAGSVKLEAGDRISFYYSLDLGADVQELENP